MHACKRACVRVGGRRLRGIDDALYGSFMDALKGSFIDALNGSFIDELNGSFIDAV